MKIALIGATGFIGSVIDKVEKASAYPSAIYGRLLMSSPSVDAPVSGSLPITPLRL